MNKSLERAHALHQQGRLEEALESYRSLLKEDPNQPDVYHLAGVLLCQMQKYDEALNHLDLAIRQNPKNGAFYSSKGNVLCRLGKYPQAALVYDHAIKLDPYSAIAFTNLANCFYRQKKIDKAKKAYQKAMEINPHLPEVYFNFGRLLTELGEYNQAIDALKKAILHGPHAVVALSQLAHIHLHRGDYAEAITYYQKRLELEPDHADTHHSVGLAYLKIKNFEEAISHLTYAIALNCNDPHCYQHLATTYIQIGDYKEALMYFMQQLEKKPTIETYYNIGVLMMYQERHKEALGYLNEAIKIKPNYTEAHLNIASIYLKQSKTANAIKHYEIALTQKPNDNEIKHILSALKNKHIAESAPIEYTEHLFNQYAPYYDKHLTLHLNYRIPQEIYKALTLEANIENPQWKILDLGCGTGLCGEYVESLAETLIGVDVSVNMLAVAENKKIYDKLENKTLESALCEYQDLNLIIAADVFAYIGNLDDIFKNANAALATNGYFVFTVEKSMKKPYELQQTIRYAHAKTYIESLIKQNHFHTCCFNNLVLRKQHNKPVEGYLVLLQKK